MPSPSIVFSFILATLYGSGFHVFAGGDARRLALFLLVAWIGFALGQVTGELLNITVLDIGPLHFASATGGAGVALMLAALLTRRLPAES